MILPLLLFVSPSEPVDEYPEPPSPCVVTWSEAISTRFSEGTTPHIERRCRELVDALDEEVPPGSIQIEVGGETAAFTVNVSLLDAEEVVFEQEADGEVCECGRDALTTFTMKQVAAAFEQRDAAKNASAPQPEEPHGKPAGPSTDGATPREIKPIGPLGIAGAVISGVGVAGVIVGAVYLPRPNESSPIESSYLTLDRTNYRTPAIGALVLGGAMVVGGTAMLVTDVVRRKKQRRKQATMVAPVLTPQTAGIALSGRF
ncbi:MAG: hypothetical protein ACE37F_00850 [Nannocystaceae bacterium]|nr:hypothetical protein [bacterium]